MTKRIFWTREEWDAVAAVFGPRDETDSPETMAELRTQLLEAQFSLPIDRRRSYNSPSTLYDTPRRLREVYAEQKKKEAKEFQDSLEKLVEVKAKPVSFASPDTYTPTLTARDKPWGNTVKLQAIMPLRNPVKPPVEVPASKIAGDAMELKLRELMPELTQAVASKVVACITPLFQKELADIRATMDSMLEYMTSAPTPISPSGADTVTVAHVNAPHPKKKRVLVFGVHHSTQLTLQRRHPDLDLETTTDIDSVRGLSGFDHLVIWSDHTGKAHQTALLSKRGNKPYHLVYGIKGDLDNKLSELV
jgi:hypothetical protein